MTHLVLLIIDHMLLSALISSSDLPRLLLRSTLPDSLLQNWIHAEPAAAIVPSLVKVEWKGPLPNLVCLHHTALVPEAGITGSPAVQAQNTLPQRLMQQQEEDLGVSIARPAGACNNQALC